MPIHFSSIFTSKAQAFLDFISQLSQDFILMEGDQVDEAIRLALKFVCQFASVERGGIFLLNPDQSHFYLSHEWCETKLPPQRQLLAQLETSQFPHLFEQLRAGKVIQMETHLLPTTGEFLKIRTILEQVGTLSFIKLPLFNGSQLIGTIDFDQTVEPVFSWTEDHLQAFTLTGQIIAHALIRKQNEVDLQTAHSRLKKENQLLEQLAYLSSHNLQAPINNLLGLVELMERVEPGDETLEIHQKIRFSAELLHRRVAEMNILLHARHQQTNNSQNVLLEPCLQRALQPLDRELKQVSAELFVDFSRAPKAPGIATYWESIFYNLVSNAGKYRSPDRPLRVHIHSKLYGDELIISVSDNGKGIDMVKHGNQIFDLHQRFHPEIEGKGIGLFLVQRQVATLGGTIRVNSEIDKGATFVLRFPQKP